MKQKKLVTYDNERNPNQVGIMGVEVRITDLPNTVHRLINKVNNLSSCWNDTYQEGIMFIPIKIFKEQYFPLSEEDFDEYIIKTKRSNDLKNKIFGDYNFFSKQEAKDEYFTNTEAKDSYFTEL